MSDILMFPGEVTGLFLKTQTVICPFHSLCLSPSPMPSAWVFLFSPSLLTPSGPDATLLSPKAAIAMIVTKEAYRIELSCG